MLLLHRDDLSPPCRRCWRSRPILRARPGAMSRRWAARSAICGGRPIPAGSSGWPRRRSPWAGARSAGRRCGRWSRTGGRAATSARASGRSRCCAPTVSSPAGGTSASASRTRASRCARSTGTACSRARCAWPGRSSPPRGGTAPRAGTVTASRRWRPWPTTTSSGPTSTRVRSSSAGSLPPHNHAALAVAMDLVEVAQRTGAHRRGDPPRPRHAAGAPCRAVPTLRHAGPRRGSHRDLPGRIGCRSLRGGAGHGRW